MQAGIRLRRQRSGRSGSALFADCFPMHDKDGRPLAHHMRFNAYNRVLDAKIGRIDQERVSAPVRFDGAIPSGMASAAEIEQIFSIGPDSRLRMPAVSFVMRRGTDMHRQRSASRRIVADGASISRFHYPFTQILDGASSKDRNNQSGRTVSRKYLAVLWSNSPNHRE